MPKMGYSRLTRSIYGPKYTVPHLVNIFGTIKLEIRYPIGEHCLLIFSWTKAVKVILSKRIFIEHFYLLQFLFSVTSETDPNEKFLKSLLITTSTPSLNI